MPESIAPRFPPQFVSAPVPTTLALYNYNQIPPNLYRVIDEGILHEGEYLWLLQFSLRFYIFTDPAVPSR